MSAAGKVCIGFSCPYVGLYNANGGNPSYSKGMRLARGVNIKINPDVSDDNDFYADNVAAESDGGVFTGGTADLTCRGNGNTAIDTNGAFANNGGTITTNDGSESGSGGMGGKGGDRILSGRGGAGGEKPSGTGKENGGMMRPTLQTQEPKTTA